MPKTGMASIDTAYPSLDDVAEALGISRTRARRAALDAKTLLEEYERELIEKALKAKAGNQRRAAAALGFLPTTLHEKMKRLGLLKRRVEPRDELGRSS